MRTEEESSEGSRRRFETRLSRGKMDWRVARERESPSQSHRDASRLGKSTRLGQTKRFEILTPRPRGQVGRGASGRENRVSISGPWSVEAAFALGHIGQ